MEIPPTSSFADVSALFGDTTESDRRKQILGIWPSELPNKHLNSLDLAVGTSVSNESKDFKYGDYQEGFRIYNGPLLYPYQDKAQIFHHKFDPFYWDGSELDGDYNVQENLIGTPLGASVLEDPRMTYVENILKLKEMGAVNDPLDNSYIQNLYMINADKGSNYYQNQLQKLQFAMGQYSRVSKATRDIPIHPIQFTKNLATGHPIHEKHTTKRPISMGSESGIVQSSRRQRRMNAVDSLKLEHHVRAHVPLMRPPLGGSPGHARGIPSVDNTPPQTPGFGSPNINSVNGSSYGDVQLPVDMSGYLDANVDQTQSSPGNDTAYLTTMGTPNNPTTPHRQQDDLSIMSVQQGTPRLKALTPQEKLMADVDEFLSSISGGDLSGASNNLFPTDSPSIGDLSTVPEQIQTPAQQPNIQIGAPSVSPLTMPTGLKSSPAVDMQNVFHQLRDRHTSLKYSVHRNVMNDIMTAKSPVLQRNMNVYDQTLKAGQPSPTGMTSLGSDRIQQGASRTQGPVPVRFVPDPNTLILQGRRRRLNTPPATPPQTPPKKVIL